MAIIQISDTDCMAKIVSWQQPTDARVPQQGLNLGSATYGASVTRTSNIIQVMEPMLAFLVVQLTSGALTANISLHNGTPNFGSPAEAFAVSGTHLLVSNRLVLGRNDTLSPGGNNMISVQTVTGGGGAAVILRAFLLLIGMFPKNAAGAVKKGYHESVYGINGLDTEAGGVFDGLLSF